MSPEEIRQIAQLLRDQGFRVIAVQSVEPLRLLIEVKDEDAPT